MTTEPLNLPDVEMAAGETAWAGLPAGSVMGHMHLQISDLESAERFFHSALGFDKVVWSFPGALFLSAGGYHHHLATNTWAMGAGLAQENEARLLEWQIVLPTAEDRARAVNSLRAAGIVVSQHGDSWVVSDPWNTTLRLA